MNRKTTLIAAAVAALLAAACYETPRPECAFLCGGEQNTDCPDDYSCRPDGWCKRTSPMVADDYVCDAVFVDASTADATTPDAPVPDAPVPDGAIADATPTPDVSVPDAAVPDAAVPDAAIPDAAIPDAAVPDASPPDAMLKADGQGCLNGTECASGNCSDLVCCNVACAGDCDACSMTAGADADGTCKILPAATVECRTSLGECDPAEMCDGINNTCPSDIVVSAGVPCTDTNVNDCDDAQCDGGGACDQAFAVEAITYECRPAAGDCDIPETCDGATGGACGSDVVEGMGTACGDASTTECTAPDTCDAIGNCLPNHTSDLTSCSSGTGVCCTGICEPGSTCP